MAFSELAKHCEQGAAPFAATVKAYLALVARLPAKMPGRLRQLAERTLGYGVTSADRLKSALQETALLLWQGVLSGPGDIARLQIPVPKAWLAEAAEPRLRVVVAWESPCNDAVLDRWASRRVKATLRPGPSIEALTGSGRQHQSYPLLDRTFDLSATALRDKQVTPPETDFWLMEVSYEEIADYFPAMIFPPTQRVGIAAELLDEAEEPVSPQAAMQALPQAVSMARLTVPVNRIANPVVVKTRV